MDKYRDSIVVDLNNVHYTDSSDAEYSGDEDQNDLNLVDIKIQMMKMMLIIKMMRNRLERSGQIPKQWYVIV